MLIDTGRKLDKADLAPLAMVSGMMVLVECRLTDCLV